MFSMLLSSLEKVKAASWPFHMTEAQGSSTCSGAVPESEQELEARTIRIAARMARAPEERREAGAKAGRGIEGS